MKGIFPLPYLQNNIIKYEICNFDYTQLCTDIKIQFEDKFLKKYKANFLNLSRIDNLPIFNIRGEISEELIYFIFNNNKYIIFNKTPIQMMNLI